MNTSTNFADKALQGNSFAKPMGVTSLKLSPTKDQVISMRPDKAQPSCFLSSKHPKKRQKSPFNEFI